MQTVDSLPAGSRASRCRQGAAITTPISLLRRRCWWWCWCGRWCGCGWHAGVVRKDDLPWRSVKCGHKRAVTASLYCVV